MALVVVLVLCHIVASSRIATARCSCFPVRFSHIVVGCVSPVLQLLVSFVVAFEAFLVASVIVPLLLAWPFCLSSPVGYSWIEEDA